MAVSKVFLSKYSGLPESAHMAKQIGEVFYFNGKKCSRGHLSKRYASSSNCLQCIEEKRGVVFSEKSKERRSPENQRRAEAAFLSGEKTYLSADPCKNGHFERFVGGNNCKTCRLEYERNRKEAARWSRINRLYGLTKDGFYEMMDSQNGLCEICKTNIDLSNTHVDHCHEKGHVRGLLCSRCNQAIGLFDESESRLFAAAKYIKENIYAKGLSN